MNILFFDTETTGIPRWDRPAHHPSQPRIVDLAGLLIESTDNGHHKIDGYESIVKPEGWTVDEGAARVHGITTAIARKEGKPIAEVLERFDAMVRKAGLLVAFNIRFDDKLLRGERRRLGRPDGFGTIPVFCVMKGATPICKMAPTDRMLAAGFNKVKTPKLSEAVSILLHREHKGAHRAMADVLATQDLYFALRDNEEFMRAGSDFKSNMESSR